MSVGTGTKERDAELNLKTLTFEASSSIVDTIETTLTDDDTHLPTSGAVWTAIDNVSLSSPTIPTSLSLTEISNYIQISFTADDDNDEYEIWASQISSSDNFDMIAIVKSDDFQGSPSAIIIIADNTYIKKSQIWYRIYAKKFGVYSSALTGTVTPTNDVGEVTGITTSSYYDSIALFWVNPEDRRLDEIKIYVDAQVVEGNLDEGNGTLCYTGMDENFTYQIPTADLTKFHEFWINTYTKT